MKLIFNTTNGVTLGIEHMTCPPGSEDLGIDYMIVIHLLVFRICLLKYS